MQWIDVLQNPCMQNLPFKIELNKWGRIEMSRASNRHGMARAELVAELRERRGGKVLVECSVQTSDGVRVADVAWISNRLLKEFGDATPYPRAPERCVEVMSPGNTWGEMHMKAGLYMKAGALEVWVVSVDGERTVMKPQP